MKRRKSIAAGALLILLVAAPAGVQWWRQRFNRASAEASRPWAYSEDPNAKLLVGKWAGNFTDPDGVAKAITLEIFPPMTGDQRIWKAGRRVRHRSGLGPGINTVFEGLATVTSRLGTENYEIDGAVEKSDGSLFHFSFGPVDEAKRILPNFTLFAAKSGHWQINELTASFSFVHHEADGSSSSTSEGVVVDGKLEWKESKDDQVATVTLKRVP